MASTPPTTPLDFPSIESQTTELSEMETPIVSEAPEVSTTGSPTTEIPISKPHPTITTDPHPADPNLIRSLILTEEVKQTLLAQQKLVLLVDLDHTIVNSTSSPFNVDIQNRLHHDLRLMTYSDKKITVKLRPNTIPFLKKVSKFYHLCITTYASAAYAKNIALILDPDQSLFGNRIYFRDDLGEANNKTPFLNQFFPTGHQIIVKIDDRADVWHHPENLIIVPQYEYFIKKRVHCDGTMVRYSNTLKTSTEEDTFLHKLEDILIELHKQFYERYSPMDMTLDVGKLIVNHKANILKGVVFYLMVRPQISNKNTAFYKLCYHLGAVVEESLTEKITHIMSFSFANFLGTAIEKFQTIPQIGPMWVVESGQKWERQHEKDYPPLKVNAELRKFNMMCNKLLTNPVPLPPAEMTRSYEPQPRIDSIIRGRP
uniref:Protein-serine/threonine phosphatase n=1 Tax=Rhabditophanes sp. KR3021 TaxID=114890 RepID=A0AC35TXW1_9BILA